jgi:uncharacterized protein
LSVHRNDPTAPFSPATRRRRAVDAISCVLIAAVILVAATGDSVRRAGEQMRPGVIHDVVSAAGGPAGWLADRLPIAGAADRATAFLSPDQDLAGGEGFALSAGQAAAGDAVAPVTADAFDPRELGAATPQRRRLRRLLVTGDSMAMPLDAELARRYDAADGVTTVREPHIGTGISKTGLLDWGRLAVRQVAERAPDAVVMFLGANEGFAMRARGGGAMLECCDARWAAVYASRVRLMMNAYRRGGAARVYWLTLPAPRDRDRALIARAVNAAIRAAAAPYRAQVRVVSIDSQITPGWRYQDAIEIDGRQTLVRDADGIHLNKDGAAIAADSVSQALQQDFTTTTTP